ncbi:WD40 repeat-like protein [Mycena olivaceomarginata]|nr:WD40 repeat-like protein [Mycena olivaceomarginata]
MNSLQLTTPNRLRRRGSPATPPNTNTQRFSRLLTSVLGSPFLTTAEMSSLPPHLDLVDGDDTAVLHADTVTRPASPDLLYGFEVVHREDGADDDQWPFKRASPFRSLLPRIWDVISASPPRPSYLKQIDYTQLPPLDGEEGELIDDEACFFCPPVRAVTGIDILTLLPPELSLHILNLLLSPTRPDPRAPAPVVLAALADHAQASTAALLALLCCRAVSRTWARLASDNAVWRAFFISRWGVPPSPPTRPSRPSPPPRTSSLTAARMKKLPPLPPDAASPLPLTPSPAPAPSWRTLYRARLALERRWGSPAVTNEIAWQPPARALSGHADSVYCLEFSRSHIFTGSRDRAVKVWSVRTGRLLGTFAGGHRGSVLCLKFELASSSSNPGGMRGTLVTGSSDCTVCVWDLWTESAEEDAEVHAEVRAVLRGHGGGVLDLRIDRRWIVSCSKDAVVRVWGRESLELERVLRGHEGPVNAVGLESGEYDDADVEDEGDAGYGDKSQRHEGRVVSASGDGKMILWDIKSGERVRTFEGHDRGLACIEFKGDLIISGSNDCKIKIWSASTGACLRTLVGHEALVRALAFDPSSGRLVSASYDRSVRVWDLGALCGAGSGGAASASAGGGSGAMRVVRDSHTSHIFDVKFDGRRIVSTSHDQKIVILDFSAGLGVDADFVV